MDAVLDAEVSSMFGISPNTPAVTTPTTGVGGGTMVVQSDEYPPKPTTKLLPTTLPAEDLKVKRMEQDFVYVRETMHSTINQGNDALVDLVNFAKTSGGPAAFKEVAGLIKSIAGAGETLLKLHQLNADVQPKKEKSTAVAAPVAPQQTQQNASKITNIYTGKTTADILEDMNSDDPNDDESLWSEEVLPDE